MLLEKLKYWLLMMGNFYFPKKNPKQNIGLEGELDDVEILEHVEKKFSIKISDFDACRITNIGEFYAVVVAESAKVGLDVYWDEFLNAIESYSRLPISEIKKETEFYHHIKRWKN